MKIYIVYVENYYGEFQGLLGSFTKKEAAVAHAETLGYEEFYVRDKHSYTILELVLDEGFSEPKQS